MKPTEQSMIDPGRVFGNRYYFATNYDRGRYGGTIERKRPQWLKDNPDVWILLEDALRGATFQQRRVESTTEAAAAGSSSSIPSDMRKDDKEADSAASVAIADGVPSPVRPPALATDRVKTVVAPDAFGWEIEIVIEARGYVSAQQFASKSRISRKTLSRRIATGKVPPMIKIGNKLFFEVSGIRGGPASDESHPAH